MGSRRTLAILLCCLAMVGAAHAADPCGDGKLVSVEVRDDTLTLQWAGTVGQDMDRRIADEFDRVKHQVKTVALGLSSCGGSSRAMKQMIEVLQAIKQRHDLATVVRHGDLCASACVSVFLEGSRRVAAQASLWLFHEPSRRESASGDGVGVTNAKATEQMLKEFALAGVSKRWLKGLRAKIKGADYWQTGRDLWEAKSGIITEVLGNSVPRETREQDVPIALSCILCSDPRISYAQKPRPEYLPDFIDMLGQPTGR